MTTDNSGEIIQSEYHTTRIMVHEILHNHHFYMWNLFIKNSITQAFRTYFHISIEECLNCLGPVEETLPKSTIWLVDSVVFMTLWQIVGKSQYREYTTLLPRAKNFASEDLENTI